MLAVPVAAALVAAVLTACGGGSPAAGTPDAAAPTAALDLQDGALERNRPLVIRFSESMDAGSLQLAGDLGTASLAAWSTDRVENDTLTLTPRSGWPAGPGRALVIDAKDRAGNALATLKASFLVTLLANFQSADGVIGQADFSSNDTNRAGPAGALTLNSPSALAASPDGTLFVSDSQNHRVLVYGRVPTAPDTPASAVLGQPDFTRTVFATSRDGMKAPGGLSVGAGKMLVADTGNHRVLVYNGIPTATAALPDVVLGQPDFASSAFACGPASLRSPEAAFITAGGQVLVTDSNHHRVLIWRQAPATHGQPPDLVLGQSDGTHCRENDDDQDDVADAAPTARTLNYPAGVWSDGQRVVVVDNTNNRVLIWNTFPASSFQPADIVLGQASFAGGAGNDDDGDGASDPNPTARTFDDPFLGVSSNGVQLAITDTVNHRVLVWNAFPTRSFQPADLVIGHSSFTKYVENDADEDGNRDVSASPRTLVDPYGILFVGDKLLVTDAANNRVLVFTVQ